MIFGQIKWKSEYFAKNIIGMRKRAKSEYIINQIQNKNGPE